MNLDIDQMLSSGALEGPYRAPHPYVLRAPRRFFLALAAFLLAARPDLKRD